jgi:hypothetical protein
MEKEYPDISQQGIEFPEKLKQNQDKIDQLSKKMSSLLAKNNELKKTVLIECLGWSVGGGRGDWSGCGAKIPVSTLDALVHASV